MLLNRISHELRSPLTAILGRVQLMKKMAADSPYVERNVPALERSAEVLAGLVGDLLDASRAQSGKLRVRLQPILLAPLVAHAADDGAIAAARKQIRMNAAVDPVPETLADAARVEQVVANLLSNAVKFTPSGGLIDVRLTASDSTIQLRVMDTGVGIEPSFLPHVFEPFQQASEGETRDGLGLGLAIVKSLVQAHGGTIDVHSEGPGRGTTVVVDLPIRTAQLPEPADRISRSHVVN
jgi:signal transduction histidine kinase